MDVRPCLDIKAEWQGGYSNQVQVLYHFIVLLIVLILLLVGAIPSWPYSRGWGYGPSGLLGVVLVVVLILALTGRV